MRVQVTDLTKRYAREGVLLADHRERPALDGITLDIADGETLCLVGPSGCGKSSLLRMIAGLESPDAGQVRYNGHDVAEVAPQDRGVGMVFQDYALYPSMKGKGNLSYFFEVHQRTEAEARQRAEEVADIMGVGFDVLLGQRPGTLSGGEQQRVAIARCIVRDPTLFLMDEPICNLDAKLRESTRMEIKKLLRKFGITTVYVTHDQQEAVFVGDRIAVLRDGRLAQVGSFDDLYYEPVDLFVASFIGTRPMAVVPVAVENGEVFGDGFRWELPKSLTDVVPNGRLRLGVRPEAWEYGVSSGVSVTVERIEHVPTERLTLAHGMLGDARLTVAVPETTTEGESLRLLPDWERASFFAADSEAAVHTPGVPDFF